MLLKCKALWAGQESELQMRVILGGSSSGQPNQAVTWLDVGEFQRPGGLASGK